MLKMGVDPYMAMLAALGIGLAVGGFNGYLVAFVGIPSFIVTLGGLTLWRGLAFDATGGFDNAGLPDPFPFIGYGTVFGVPMPTVIMVLVFVLMAFVLSSTKLGRYVYAIGSNEMGARQVGINIRWYKLGVYVVSGLACGLAAIVRGTSLFGGRGSIWGSLLGAVLITMIRNGMNLLEISQFKQMMAIGAVVIIAVWIDVLRRQHLLKK